MKKHRPFLSVALVVLALAGVASPPAHAAKKPDKKAAATPAKKSAKAKSAGKTKTRPPAKAKPEEKTGAAPITTITIVGSKKRARGLPGSAAFVEKKELATHGQDDVAKVLRSVPGVFVREEDGNGLFPGISLRGVDSGRSAKVSLMEDGILIAPAPYSSPSAYYSPTIGRMAGLEVLKGSSQIKYGPHTTGGAINYLSTPIPGQYAANVKMQVGSYHESLLHATVGDTLPRGKARLGYLVEVYRRSSKGFKKIDPTGFLATPGQQDTGFEKLEPMLKLSYEPGAKRYQKWELKWALSDLASRETYLGITGADFRRDPYRRYAASAFDNIPSLHHQVTLRHTLQNTPNTDTSTVLYWNKFRRSWFKHDGPITSANANTLAVIQGLADGTWTYVNNNRTYTSKGAQTTVRHRAVRGATRHNLELGLRWHEDEERRFQNTTIYTVSGSSATGQPGPFITNTLTGAPGSKDNQLRRTKALSLYLQDTVERGRLSLTPGLRAEWVDMRYADFNKTNPAKPWEQQAGADFTMLAMGLGGTWQASKNWKLLGGIHQGVSPPGPDGATAGDRARPYTPSANLREENALSVELGGRYENPRRALALEAVLFHTDFNDLVVTGNAGAGGIAGVTFNGGDITTRGLEFQAQWDPASARGKRTKTPLRFTLTRTRATIDDTSAVTGGIFAGGSKGAQVPYVPRLQWQLEAGVENARAGGNVAISHTGPMWSTAANTTSAADERIGRTDKIFTVDLSGFVAVGKNTKATVNLQNLFDKEYIAVRHPHGPRPGKPFTALLGLEWSY